MFSTLDYLVMLRYVQIDVLFLVVTHGVHEAGEWLVAGRNNIYDR